MSAPPNRRLKSFLSTPLRDIWYPNLPLIEGSGQNFRMFAIDNVIYAHFIVVLIAVVWYERNKGTPRRVRVNIVPLSYD